MAMAVRYRTPYPASALYTDVRPHVVWPANCSGVNALTTSARLRRAVLKRPDGGCQRSTRSVVRAVVAIDSESYSPRVISVVVYAV